MRRFILVWLLLLLVEIAPAPEGQNSQSNRRKYEEPVYHLNIVRPKVPKSSAQEFVCVSPYELGRCEKHIEVLQVLLSRYRADELGKWTWILVLSDDWKQIAGRLHVDLDAVAFSQLQMRQTFFEEVLLGSKPQRQIELLKRWAIPLDQFLHVAVTHELGHAFCRESDDIKAEHAAQRLRKGTAPSALCS